MWIIVIFGFFTIVAIVALKVSNVIVNAMKGEVNQFQLGLARWVIPVLVSLLIFLIVGLVISLIKFIAGLFQFF